MIPQDHRNRAGWSPRAWALLLALAFALTLGTSDAEAQKRRRSKPKPKPAPAPAAPAPTPEASADAPDGPAPQNQPKKKMAELDFTGLDLAGRLRTPQLLYFLERASAELEAASLERRSFVPEMVRSMDEESL